MVCATSQHQRYDKTEPLTGVGVFGVDDGDGRSDRGVVEHGDLVVAGEEARRVVVHVLDQQHDVRLTRPPPSVRRLGHQVVLDLTLTVQHGHGEQLPWEFNRTFHIRENKAESSSGPVS